jgi:protein required for attachment to host cells
MVKRGAGPADMVKALHQHRTEPAMKADWILIANAAHARLIAREPGSPMVVLKSFEHAASRSKVGDLADDQAGREKSDSSYGGAALPPRLDAKTKEQLHFARELADYLEPHAQQHAFHRLAVYASSPFLGELKDALRDGTRRLLDGSHDLDLTSFGLSEIERRIGQESPRAAH